MIFVFFKAWRFLLFLAMLIIVVILITMLYGFIAYNFFDTPTFLTEQTECIESPQSAVELLETSWAMTFGECK